MPMHALFLQEVPFRQTYLSSAVRDWDFMKAGTGENSLA